MGAMKENAQLLILSPYPTFPDHVGGKIRIVQLARHLAEQGYQVKVIEPFAFGRGSKADRDGTNRQRIKYPFLIPYLLTDRLFPYQYLVSFHPGYEQFIADELKEYDIYQFEHASFADLVDAIPAEKPIVYDAHNVEYDYVSSECSNRLLQRIVATRMFSLEGKLAERASLILACSQEDKQRFVELYNVSSDKIVIAPNGIRKVPERLTVNDSLHAATLPALRYRNRALFSGSDVEHNRKAVQFIIHVLAPQLEADCSFIIKGPCGQNFQKHSQKNVFIDTSIGSIAPLAQFCTVGINPVTQGGGTNLKLLDYLAHGLPVVSTEFGIRGYHDLRDVVTVCSLDRFTSTLRKEYARPAKISERLQPYLWSEIAARVAAEYERLVNRSDARRTVRAGANWTCRAT